MLPHCTTVRRRWEPFSKHGRKWTTRRCWWRSASVDSLFSSRGFHNSGEMSPSCCFYCYCRPQRLRHRRLRPRCGAACGELATLRPGTSCLSGTLIVGLVKMNVNVQGFFSFIFWLFKNSTQNYETSNFFSQNSIFRKTFVYLIPEMHFYVIKTNRFGQKLKHENSNKNPKTQENLGIKTDQSCQNSIFRKTQPPNLPEKVLKKSLP